MAGTAGAWLVWVASVAGAAGVGCIHCAGCSGAGCTFKKHCQLGTCGVAFVPLGTVSTALTLCS